MDSETPDARTSRRITAAQKWLAATAAELRRAGFYGELTVTLKFEEGQCVVGEQLIRERTK